jgi:hypothetical protein
MEMGDRSNDYRDFKDKFNFGLEVESVYYIGARHLE